MRILHEYLGIAYMSLDHQSLTHAPIYISQSLLNVNFKALIVEIFRLFSGTLSKWFHQSMGHTNPLGFCFCAITGVIATLLLNLPSIRYVYSVHNLFSNDEQEDNILTLC